MQFYNKSNKMSLDEILALRKFIIFIKTISQNANNLQRHKRELSKAVVRIQDYIQCFRLIDLDKKGVIYPKVIQQYLISKKYFHDPFAISRYYHKYSHQKQYLSYEDFLEALLPHSDFILVSRTISNPQLTIKSQTFTYSCDKQRAQTISHLTAFIISQQLKYQTQQYAQMLKITNNSYRIGAILWRMLDRDHDNNLTFSKIHIIANDNNIVLHSQQWSTFLYWYFHSYKTSMNRDDFMRILDVQEQRKRANSACKIEQFKIQKELYVRAEEGRRQQQRIQQSLAQKLSLMPHMEKRDISKIVKEQHLPYQILERKRLLSSKIGYKPAKNLVKYIVER